MGNLLENSLRYTDAPGQVLVQIQSDGNRVAIIVEDTAPGLSPVDLLRIFEPLYRADLARGREAGGSGLGLAICQQIVHAHHGVIRAKASPKGGVQFLIELPSEGDTEA
jgi:two-component system sensor histidine kinase BaeS